MARKVTKVPGMTPLQALVLGRMREKQWDAKAVEARGVSHATLHRYMNPVVLRQLPRQRILESLASALDLSVDTVRQAAVESLVGQPEGWRGSVHLARQGDLDIAIVVERVDRLPITEADLSEGVEAVRAYLLEGADSHAAPMTHAEDVPDSPAVAALKAQVRDDLERALNKDGRGRKG